MSMQGRNHNLCNEDSEILLTRYLLDTSAGQARLDWIMFVGLHEPFGESISKID